MKERSNALSKSARESRLGGTKPIRAGQLLLSVAEANQRRQPFRPGCDLSPSEGGGIVSVIRLDSSHSDGDHHRVLGIEAHPIEAER